MTSFKKILARKRSPKKDLRTRYLTYKPEYGVIYKFLLNRGATGKISSEMERFNLSESYRKTFNPPLPPTIIPSIEQMWIKEGFHHYFIGSQLLRQIKRANFDIDIIRSPQNTMSFAIPEGTVIDGIPIVPCIFATDVEDVCLVARLPNDQEGYSVMTSKRNRLGRFLSDDDYFMDQSLEWDNYQLTDEESRLMRSYLRLFCGILVYMRCFPERTMDGAPDDGYSEGREFERGSIHHVACPSLERGEVGAHYRRWHFRTLRDDRYKRDEYGDCRIVFVNDTIVHPEKLTPHTIE